MSSSDEATRRHGWVEWTQLISNIAVILSALVVVPLYLVERDDTNRLERQQLAAEMFQRKYDDRVMSAYIKVSDAFDSRNALFAIFNGAQEDAKRQLSADIIETAGLENIKIVIDYYNDLLVCVEEGLCDKELASSLIDQDIRNFYCKARYVGLPQLRERYSYPTYGERLASFAGNCDK
jgi:hypothetical protein